MSDKIPVSVLIIAQNEETIIRRCLDTLREFDEVVIIDGGSTDNTQEICESYSNVKFYSNPWPGFIAQRNFSLTKASHPWCLMMDADEAATDTLAPAVRDVLSRPHPKKMYRIVRTEYFEGEAIEKAFGRSWYQDRLFQRDHIQYTGGVHHQHLIDGELAPPEHPEVEELPMDVRILHDDRYGLDEWLRKLPRFTTLLAGERMKKGKTTNAFLVVMAFVGTFFQIYAKSWRQGRRGFVISLMTSVHRGLIKLIMYNQRHFREQKIGSFEKKYLG